MDCDSPRNRLEIGGVEGVSGESDELKVGMEVSNETEAYELCNTYAFNKGFSIRKGSVRRDSQNNIRQRDFYCSKEGFHLDADIGGAKKVSRLDTRTGCKALIRFNVDNGTWKIAHTNLTHNHEFARPEERKFLRSSRHITSVRAAIVGSKVDASMERTKSRSYLERQIGCAGNSGFGITALRGQNCLQRMRDEMIEGKDGQNLLNYFKHQQLEDPNFFYSVQVDQYNRMTNFFWRDNRSKLDYDCFGDVVYFDTKFRTMKYNLICAPFVGVNHHWKNVLFGCAFLLDESTESFTWLFETFLQSMGHNQPKTIFTDEDNAMENAVKIVLPETHHRLCTRNILKNVPQHLSSCFDNPEFKDRFNKCLHGYLTEAEFDAMWDGMVQMLNLRSDLWLKKIYLLREKLCRAFSKDTFTANIESDQRGESINTTFHQISTKTMDLTGLACHYDKKTKVFRLAESEEDFRCKNGMPHLRVNSGIFKQAATEYTVKMYSLFENELMSIFGVRMMEVGSDGNKYIYEAIEEGHERVYTIQFNSSTSQICCSCKLFESMGLLCRHALKVLDLKNFTNIPAQYIMKRWTKGANKKDELSKSSYKKVKSAQSLRLSDLSDEGSNVFSIGSLCDSGTRIVKRKLMEAMKLLESDEETTSILGKEQSG